MGTVKPEAQWYLVEQLSMARASLGVRNDYEAKRGLHSHFAGVLAAFRYVGDITQDEENEWNRKMLVALGYELPDPPPPGTSQAVYLGDPGKRPAHPLQPSDPPVFIRAQSGPDREFEIHGGRLRVITVEFYDSVVVVRWRVSPDPDLALAFPEETLALEQDLVGLEDWASEELRSKGRRSLIMMRLFRGFSLTDDLGTSYMPKGQSHGGQPGERSGQSRFLPAVPSSASVLTFTWLGLDVPIPVAGEAVS